MKSPWSVPWLTWVIHLSVSALATYVQILFDVDPQRAASYPIVFYLAREIDQLLRKLWKRYAKKQDVEFNWYDIGLDALSAVVGAEGVAILL